MKYYCNPINVPYRYQFNMDPRSHGKLQIDREAADPSMIFFKGKYYIFASMNLSVWVSEDLADWQAYRLPENLPLYDYAPDARVCGDYVYFCASRKGENCNYYRTKNIIEGPYEEIPGTFDFWDPNLFFDEDGKVYFYFCFSNITPVWGVELEPSTMLPRTEGIELISGNGYERGYERMGVDNCEFPRSEEEVEAMFQGFLKSSGMTQEQMPAQYIPQIRGMFTRRPFIEGPWMEKHEGKYYLQYACPGAEYNVYADGVYVSDSPLGPFQLAQNNPFSYHPGGFMPGAGHGSTMWDRNENLWHASTMRISVNHQFERRVGIWPAGFDEEGELFCNQNYGDWPIAVEEGKRKPSDVRAIQINFADDDLPVASPGKIQGSATQPRYIEERDLCTRWKLEGSLDGKEYFMIEDKSEAVTDLPHDLVIREEGILVRFVRLTVVQIPYDVAPCISGLRLFGPGAGEKPAQAGFRASRSGDRLDMLITIEGKSDASGYNILWGHKEDKLYHSYQIFRAPDDVRSMRDAVIEKRIGALVKEREYYVRVDAYNENGITRGKTIKLQG